MSFFVNTLNGVASASYLAEKMTTSTGPRNLSVTTGSHSGLYDHDMNNPTASYTDTYAVEATGPAPPMAALPPRAPAAAPAPPSAAATSTPYLGLLLVGAAFFLLLKSKGKR
jgi:hypothetical protein